MLAMKKPSFTVSAHSNNSQEFHQFTQSQDIEHEFSSPHFSQSNSAAEEAVKIAKKCLKEEDPFLALMMHISTPHSATGVSPAELLYGRKLRTTVPVLSSSLKPSGPTLLSFAKKISTTNKHTQKTTTSITESRTVNSSIQIKMFESRSTVTSNGNLQQSKKLTTSRAAIL